MSRHRYRCDLRPLALVLNEDAMVRALQVGILQQSGFRVLDAETTDEAFDIITRRSDVEVVVSGGSMRGSITGPELTQFVSSSWPRIKVMTSEATDAGGPTTEIVRTVRTLMRRASSERRSARDHKRLVGERGAAARG